MPEHEPWLLNDGDARNAAATLGGSSAAHAARPPLTPDAGDRPAPARASAPSFYVAGFWRRGCGALLDCAIIIPVSVLMCWLAGTLGGIALPASRHHGVDFWLDLLLASDPALVGALGLTLAIAAVYLLVFQITLGRTLGMKALKIRIIDIYGDEPSTARAVVRTIGYVAGIATLGLGFLWIGFDSEKRGLHDWISSTYVVKG
jgi:uncharacterized RDD family membrane protein YckC